MWTTLATFNRDRKNWPLYAAVALVLFLISAGGWIFSASAGPEVITKTEIKTVVDQEAVAKLQAKLNSLSKAYARCRVKAGQPRPSTMPGCPDCPACPEIEAECGGDSSGSGSGTSNAHAGNRVTATADALTAPAGGGGLFFEVGASIPLANYRDGGLQFKADTDDAELAAGVGRGTWTVDTRWNPGKKQITFGPRYRFGGARRTGPRPPRR